MFIPKISGRPPKMHKNYNCSLKKKELSKLNFGVSACSYAFVNFRQLEALRRFIYRRLRKKTFKLIRVSLTHTVYKKPSKSRMGKGSGKFYKWYGYVAPGQMLFEFFVIYKDCSKLLDSFSSIATKMPFKCAITYKKTIFNLSELHKDLFF